jgi:hypothetical protein
MVASANIEFKKNSPNQEYYFKLKKRKLMYVYQIYESLLIINRNEAKIFDNGKELKSLREYRYIENIFLGINDNFLLVISLNITILFILAIISKDLAIVTIRLMQYIIKYICRRMLQLTVKGNEIAQLLEMEKLTLLGLYFKIMDRINKAELLSK